ncbi:redoxin domain-containing protein [bacterium]|nr:redoxin domain-containing protein [bacterium]
MAEHRSGRGALALVYALGEGTAPMKLSLAAAALASAALVAVSSSRAEDAPKASEVLEKVKERYAKIQDLSCTTKSVERDGGQSLASSCTLLWKRPDKLVCEIKRGDEERRAGFDGTWFWRYVKGTHSFVKVKQSIKLNDAEPVLLSLLQGEGKLAAKPDVAAIETGTSARKLLSLPCSVAERPTQVFLTVEPGTFTVTGYRFVLEERSLEVEFSDMKIDAGVEDSAFVPRIPADAKNEEDDAPRPTPPAAEAKGLAPELEATDLSGKAIKLSDFRGKVVVLDLFATWCPPCRREIPGFIDIQSKYAGRVVVLGITHEAAKNVKPFVEKEKINYAVATVSSDKLDPVYDGEQIPRTFVIDAKGNFVAKHTDFAEESFFVEKIEQALKAK